jgi:hypothetical protein
VFCFAGLHSMVMLLITGSMNVFADALSCGERELDVSLGHHVQHAGGERLVRKSDFLGPGA